MVVPTPSSNLPRLIGRQCHRCDLAGPVEVLHGANHGIFLISGSSVASVQFALQEVFNIPADAVAAVNGDFVFPDSRLRTSDTLEFLVLWGRKGQDDKPFPPDGYRLGDPCPYLLTEAEAIRYLRLDTIGIANPDDTLRRYRDMGLLRATQVSKKLFYLRRELDLFLARITERNAR